MGSELIGTFILVVLLSAVGGWSPFAITWACYGCVFVVGSHFSWEWIYMAAVLTYSMHGVVLELLPFGHRINGSRPSIHIQNMLPNVVFNVASASIMIVCAPSRDATSDSPLDACVSIGIAIVGNEVIYSTVHRILHTPALYRFHKLHHTQRVPRALGAAYCHPVEMWTANLSSFILPLYVTGRLHRDVLLLWVVSGIMGSQHHHSSTVWPWTRFTGDTQPSYHNEHHVAVAKHYGNLGFMEPFLKKKGE